MTAPVVLLVDDNEDCRIIYGATLRHAGYSVRTAVDGIQCLGSVAEQVPDLILLDIGMPRMSGMEALDELKKDPRLAGVPVVAVSARVGKERQESVRQAGFTEVLLKPVSPADLLATVQRHVPIDRN